MPSTHSSTRLGGSAILANSLLVGGFWLFAQLGPSAFTLGSTLLGSALAALLLLALSARRLSQLRELFQPRAALSLVAAGVLLIASGAVSLWLQATNVPTDLFVPLSFVPLLVWFFTPRHTAHLFAALAAVAAALLIFPFHPAHSLAAWSALLLPLLTQSAGIVVAAHTVRRHQTPPLCAAVFVATGFALAFAAGFFAGPTLRENAQAAALHATPIALAPTLLGTVYAAAVALTLCLALTASTSLRASILYPGRTLFAIAAGFVLYFRYTTWRLWLGLFLLLYAIVALWRTPPGEAPGNTLHLS